MFTFLSRICSKSTSQIQGNVQTVGNFVVKNNQQGFGSQIFDRESDWLKLIGVFGLKIAGTCLSLITISFLSCQRRFLNSFKAATICLSVNAYFPGG